MTKNLANANEKQAKYLNINRREVTFDAEDQVARRNHVISSAAKDFTAKLAQKFVDPSKIV